MFKNIKAIKGVKSLTKGEQKTISGGFFGFVVNHNFWNATAIAIAHFVRKDAELK